MSDSSRSDADARSDCGVTDYLQFFRSWVSNPLRVAALAPSGEALARIMTMELSAKDGPVLELGPGTGVFTRALLDRGIAEADLTLIEYGSDFATMLQMRFPTARVLWMDATQIRGHRVFEGQTFGATISGLPLLTMPPRKVFMILLGAFSAMRPNAAFYQFTYGPRCPVSRPLLDRLGLKAQRIGGTALNVPPASVYKITRRNSLSLVGGSIRDRA